MFDDFLAKARRSVPAAVKDLVQAPDRVRALDAECAELRGRLEQLSGWSATLEAWVDEEAGRARLATARARVLLVLVRAAAQRARALDDEAVEHLVGELQSLAHQAELAQALHQQATADLARTREEHRRREAELGGSTSRVQELEKSREDVARNLEDTAAKLEDLEAKHRLLMGDVRKATRHVVEKLIDRGFSSSAIEEIVPDIGGAYPGKKLRELEEAIRKHNAEQEALLGLKKLFPAGPRPTGLPESPPEMQAARPPTFFERVFME